MSNISEKLNIIKQAKDDIKTVLENKGIEVGDVGIQEYAGKMSEIESINDYFSNELLIGNSSSPGILKTIKKIPDNLTIGGTGTNVSYLFCNLVNLIDAPMIDTSLVKTFNNMCRSCSALKSVPLYDTSNAETMINMLYGCSALTCVPNFNTPKCKNFSYFLAYCTSLTTVPPLDASMAENVSYMLANDKKITTFGGLLNLGKAYTQPTANYSNYKFDVSACEDMTLDSLINILLGVYDLNLSYRVDEGGMLYTQQIVVGPANLEKLNATIEGNEAMFYAIHKGWSLS